MSEKPPKRQLQLLITRGPTPFILSAVLLTDAACTAGGDGQGIGGTHASDGSTAVTSTGTPTSATAPFISPSDDGIITIVPRDPPPRQDVYTIEVPDAGAIPVAGEVCGLALVELQNTGQLPVTFGAPEYDRAVGFIEVPDELQATLVGTPTIEVIDSAGFPSPNVSEVTANENGYQFDFHFSTTSGRCRVFGVTWVALRVTYYVACEGGAREMHSVTEQHLCVDETTDQYYWATSGTCVAPGICRVIAEMAPSPIVPDAPPDGLPLAHVIRLRVVELARVANSVLLWAENDGGAMADYEWHVTGGEVQRIAPDLVLWTLHQGLGAPLAQVSVYNEHAAAVVSWAFNREVA